MEVVFQASSEVRYPILFATSIVIVVFLPLLALSGVEGRMLRPLGITYIISIFASLLVALTVTPALCAYLLPGARVLEQEEGSWFIRKLKAAYAPVLSFSMDKPRILLVSCLLMLVGALLFVPLPPAQESIHSALKGRPTPVYGGLTGAHLKFPLVF